MSINPNSGTPVDRHPGVIRWHYTCVSNRLDKILESGVVKQATAFVEPGQLPAVWFSIDQTWDNTANKMYRRLDGSIAFGTKETTHLFGGGLARVGVTAEHAPIDWNGFKAKSGISATVARGLYKAALSVGVKAGTWYCRFEPLPRELWHAVQLWDGDTWFDIPTDSRTLDKSVASIGFGHD